MAKVSADDLAWLHPGRRAGRRGARGLARGPAVVLLTRGGDGAVVVTAEHELAVAAPAAEVVDTIGAGDAFGAGFLSWWGERELGPGDLGDLDTVVAAADFACRVAAKTCERAGASPPYRREL